MDLQVDWTPGIGDPTFMGWFTVVAYFGAAVLAAAMARASRRIPPPERGRQHAVWVATTIFLVALGINKQLDLQSWFTAFGRAVLKKEGWMERHRLIQFVFMVAFTASAGLVLVVAAWCVRRRRREYWLLMLGVTFTVTFIVLRAASFHHFDVLLNSYVRGVKVNWALELGGIGIMGAAAATRLRYVKTLRADAAVPACP